MIKRLDENPRITDVILFDIETPDGMNCFSSDPYKVDSVIIYYVERDFLGTNFGEYENQLQDAQLLAKVEAAQESVCLDPSDSNLFKLSEAQSELENTTNKTKFYYKDRSPVKIIGNSDFPAWLSTDTDNAYLKLASEDAEGNPQFGHFTYEWNPQGKIREGDYFICWTWTPLPAGEKLSAHTPFKISGDPHAVTSIPTHVTTEDKYEILLERYLPEMYKAAICDGDLTPKSTDRLNKAVAEGFTFMEDMANQIIDLFDSNALHESMLTYLSNLFDVKLRSSDPTLWRRQIKEAIPLFKKKGTLSGLQGAFSQCGMSLSNYTQFWQITSPYTWEESFLVDGTDDLVFQLEKDNISTPIDDTNFTLHLREFGSTTYTDLNKDYVSFESGDDCVVHMTWTGNNLSSNPINLIKGDIVRVRYEYKEVPDAAQTIQDYILSLPLQDQRDEGNQVYPPKNWNVRLISEDDPMFDILIPVRHPFHDPIVFGFIRTEFPYSENIYNMEEYNGSTRPSFDACQIDRDFIDPCGACISSSYMVDVGIEELNNDRLLEAKEILQEYMPFHAELHSINFSGEVNEFVQSPVEEIDFLINIDFIQSHLSGQANSIFHRIAEDPFSSLIPDRNDLSDKLTVLSGKLGTGHNNHVSFVCPDTDLDSLGIMLQNNILEVLAPSSNAGTYEIDAPSNRTAQVVSTVTEPLNSSEFTFNLSNVFYSTAIADITQDDMVKLSDPMIDFVELGVKSQWDAMHTPDYTGGAWKVSIPDYSVTPYEIRDVVDGALVLASDPDLPTTNVTGVSFTLLTDTDDTVDTSTAGVLGVDRRGFVDLKDNFLLDRENFILAGDFLYYDGDEYQILGFQGDKLWIKDWVNGSVGGASINTRRRLISMGTGLFGYKGLHLTTFTDHESEFSIINGSNPPMGDHPDDDNFKENYMFKIGNDFFRIEEWDGKNVVLSGREQTWMTSATGGTAVAYLLVHFPKKQVNVEFTVFDHLDRDGQDVIIREILDQVDQNVAVVALAANEGSGIEENVSVEEGVSFIIETQDGQNQEGEI